jgi:sugar lactone lactonase YvrE
MIVKTNRLHRTAVTVALSAVLAGVGCGGGGTADLVIVDPAPVALPEPWTYDESMIFPADRSLVRPEDGVALPDGRLIVVDQVHGLRLVETDGSSAPFGNMVEAGYRHEPPPHDGGANGIALEPSGAHALIADIHHGAIFRVDVASGEAELVYQHRYGVNTAVRDSRGTIWFTQSAHNTPEEGGARMWAAVDRALAEGALYRLEMRDGVPVGEAELVVDSLVFGNGIAIDEAGGYLYLAETMGSRVLRYRVNLDSGQLSERTVILDGVAPDNLELDGDGNLWVAAPLTNEVVVVDTATGEHRSVFQVLTAAQQETVDEVMRRIAAGEPCMELLTPDAWAPLPGFVTGVIVGPGDGPVYVTGLGNALVRLPRRTS